MSLEISWHNMAPSEAVEEDVRKRYAKLHHFCDDISSARVTLDQPHRHRSNERLRPFDVRMELQMPHKTIVVDRPAEPHIQLDLYLLVHHVFDAARRQIQDYKRIREGKVKRHSAPAAPPLNEDPVAD
ncbi:MAG: HPF/RaiA family ribosome-associated protein [Pseudomonadales bacterium]